MWGGSGEKGPLAHVLWLSHVNWLKQDDYSGSSSFQRSLRPKQARQVREIVVLEVIPIYKSKDKGFP